MEGNIGGKNFCRLGAELPTCIDDTNCSEVNLMNPMVTSSTLNVTLGLTLSELEPVKVLRPAPTVDNLQGV
jgi:hypothetical protein